MALIDSFSNAKSSETRDYTATAIIGDKRQGKTTLAKLLIDEYLAKYPRKRVIVYDISNAFGPDKRSRFKGYPLVTLEQLRAKKNRWHGAVRLAMQDHEEVLSFACEQFRNGLLVIDEATTVMTDNPTDKRKAIMITHTNAKVDIYMIFHALAYVPKRLRGNFWHYMFFKTPDEIGSWKDIQSLGFPNAQQFFEKWQESQRAPHRDDRILQYFTIFSRSFQDTSNK